MFYQNDNYDVYEKIFSREDSGYQGTVPVLLMDQVGVSEPSDFVEAVQHSGTQRLKMAQANTIRFRTLAEELGSWSLASSQCLRRPPFAKPPNLMQDMHAIAVAAAGCLAC